MKKFIKIAKNLGIVLPACFLPSTTEAKETNGDNIVNNEITILHEDLANSHHESNSVKARIIQSYNSESTISPYQIGHTNVHANYKIKHTNTHANYNVKKKHVNSHSNTPSKHVNDHSNSKI